MLPVFFSRLYDFERAAAAERFNEPRGTGNVVVDWFRIQMGKHFRTCFMQF